ncbi:MAG: hypothetical protein JNL72_02375 [Flavipsychrobacter sp.]|nr:hypothetical protein [Flavipsychrobacter sp.]
MRILGIVLIVAGVLLFLFNSVSFTQKKEVAEIGPLEINKTETRKIGWPVYTGGIVIGAGVVLLIAASKKKG